MRGVRRGCAAGAEPLPHLIRSTSSAGQACLDCQTLPASHATDTSPACLFRDSYPVFEQMVNIVKMYPKADCSAFDCLGRVYAGTIKVRQG